LAGTGKTTLVALLPEFLPDAEIAFATFTGQALSVLRRKLPASVPPERVTTLHKLLYKAHQVTTCELSEQVLKGKADRCQLHIGSPPCPVRVQVSFTPSPAPLDGIDLVVADEASMIPEQLWRDLASHGVPVLAVGDHGQLPPVQSSFNLMAGPRLRLEKIHRQAASDPAGAAILTVARWAREQGRVPRGQYGPGVLKIAPYEVGRAGLHPAEAGMVICATNAARCWHNQAMRSWLGRTGPPQAGDTVICLRNNWGQGLYNGQRGVLTAVSAPFDSGGEPAFTATAELEDLDAPWTGTVAGRPFGDPGFRPGSVRDRELALLDYGYALTCHKSQGSQAERVLVIEEDWPPPGDVRSRWLYTAVTRASASLTVAGW
jgi:exodeoxyribonuclease-5